MTSMLATDAEQTAAPRPSLETWARNEPMRHVPSAEWMAWKLDQDLRRRIDILFTAFSHLSSDDARKSSLENEFRTLCRAIDRLSDVARHTRTNHPPHELSDRRHVVPPAVPLMSSLLKRNHCLLFVPLRFGAPEGNLCLLSAPLRFGVPEGGHPRTHTTPPERSSSRPRELRCRRLYGRPAARSGYRPLGCLRLFGMRHTRCRRWHPAAHYKGTIPA